MEPRFFETPQALRLWFVAHHATEQELLVGFHKKRSGVVSITWPEAVDQALCFGWIDSIRRGIDDVSYTNRFTPRKPSSTWSVKNIARVADLTEMGLMHPAGLAAFQHRTESRSETSSFEPGAVELGPAYEKRFRANRGAWTFFSQQPPSSRKLATWWVVSAKKEVTRSKRLETLIEDSANGRRIKQLTRPTP